MFDNIPALAAASAAIPEDELEHFLSRPPVQLPDGNAIGWWLANQAIYPRLHQMAINYLTAPGMSSSLLT